MRALNLTHSPEKQERFGCLLIVLTYAQAMRQFTPWTVTDEPPGSQTASSRTTVMEQSWRTENLLGQGGPSMIPQRNRSGSNGVSVAGRDLV